MVMVTSPASSWGGSSSLSQVNDSKVFGRLLEGAEGHGKVLRAYGAERTMQEMSTRYPSLRVLRLL